MDTKRDHEVSRRTFIKTGMTTAASVGVCLGAAGQEVAPEHAKPQEPLPTRILGRTGQAVTILTMGAGRPLIERGMSFCWDAGVRCLDTGVDYANGKSERVIGDWLEQNGCRKEAFLISKSRPDRPDQWEATVDGSLKRFRTDCVDLYMVHSIGGRDWLESVKEEAKIPLDKEWANAADRLKKSGKVRFVGITSHSEVQLRSEILINAAKGGWVDAVMVSYDPKVVHDNAKFNKAVDACHKAGVGFICMKGMRAVDDMPKILPEFKDMGLSPYQAVLHAVWTDERITTVTSEMPNIPIMAENTAAARNFKPLDDAKIGAVLGLYERYGRRFCNACDGRCRRAGGTNAALNHITRALSYYERDGLHDKARELYASLPPEQRDWHGADLEAASAACVCHLDFAALLARAEAKLA